MASRTLLCWDFDWSLIEENSDTWVLQQLGAEAFYKAGRQAGTQWTQLMDECLEQAASQLGRTPADVQAALHATPFHPAMVALLRRLAAAGSDSNSGMDGGGDSGGVAGGGGSAIDVAVISDANTVYIDTILTHHGLAPAVLEVHSNPAEWRGGALRVAPYHTAPHGCRHCPSNLCKGQVLASLLRRQAAAGRLYDRVLYVGDGKGDYCPSALLLHASQHWHPASDAAAAGGAEAAGSAANGTTAAAAQRGQASSIAPGPCGSGSNRVYARESYPDGLPCSLWVMLRNEAAGGGDSSSGNQAEAEAPEAGSEVAAAGQAGGGRARVVPWSRPEELAELLSKELQLG
ncbi:hypothetical protein COHA_002801 [Chlorella ohadii]|uniref:Uncharacterized protein n=1 Tax=Chlorella ohadii TaxID=2649997 RepID=A0AAD5H438_9CHLO|nr:hypothetical protein COHA_002801 [Chlorella ohadii]